MRILAATAFLALLAGCGEQIRDDGSANTSAPAAPDRSGSLERPVQIGFDGPRFDACASYGQVSRLNPNGDNFLSVRSAPFGSAPEVDRLGPNRGVAMCQQVGDWLGVVYPEKEDGDTDCGTGSPVASVRNYEGPCRSGWVHEDFVKLIAG